MNKEVALRVDSASNVLPDRLSRLFAPDQAQAMERKTIQFVNRRLTGFLIVNHDRVLKDVMTDVRSVLIKSGLSPAPSAEDLDHLSDLTSLTNL